MKHYFYFKKGENVPQWLLRQRDGDTGEVISVAQFNVNGKVMVDDQTGQAVIWPANKRFNHIIFVDGKNKNIVLDTDDSNSINSFFVHSARYTTSWFCTRKGDCRVSPLTNARQHGFCIRTTVKCSPLPCNFNRLSNNT